MPNPPRVIIRLLLSLLPIGLTPLWGWLIADGYLNFGGGEKDLLMLFPWLLWSLIYLVSFIVLWVKNFSLLRNALWSASISTAAIFVIGVFLYLFSSGLLGVKG